MSRQKIGCDLQKMVVTNGHPMIGSFCPACGEEFGAGDFVTLLTVGPGADPIEREKCRRGEPYIAFSLPIHWVCATGEQS